MYITCTFIYIFDYVKIKNHVGIHKKVCPLKTKYTYFSLDRKVSFASDVVDTGHMLIGCTVVRQVIANVDGLSVN